MKKRTISVVLIALLLVQVLCVSAFAAAGEAVVTLDKAKNEVNVKAGGFQANEMISVIGLFNETEVSDISKVDYLNQVTADAEGNVDFTYPSKAEWVGGYVAVLLNGKFAGSADIGGDIPTPSIAIVSYTDNLSAGYAANVKVVVEATNVPEGAKVSVALFGEIADVVNGVAVFTGIVAPAEGTYPIKASLNGLVVEKMVKVNDASIIWKPVPKASGADFVATFAAKIVAAAKGFSATVNGVSATVTADSDVSLKVANAAETDKISISGVKFVEYFPSYSFTFTFN